MLYAEYDPEVEKRVVREEAFEDGMEEEKLIIAKNLLVEGSIPEFVHRITQALFGKNQRIRIRVHTKITKEQRTQKNVHSHRLSCRSFPSFPFATCSRLKFLKINQK